MALVHLSATDADGPTELRSGDTVELRLPESLSTGYRWRWRLPVTLRMVADEHVTHPGAKVDMAGSAGMRRLAFDVTSVGSHELRAELARPWEGEAKQALTFILNAV